MLEGPSTEQVTGKMHVNMLSVSIRICLISSGVIGIKRIYFRRIICIREEPKIFILADRINSIIVGR